MKRKFISAALVLSLAGTLALTGCGGEEAGGEDTVIKVGATPAPHAEVLEVIKDNLEEEGYTSVSYTHLRAHETGRNLVCRLLLEKKKKKKENIGIRAIVRKKNRKNKTKR